jgi:putative transposase
MFLAQEDQSFCLGAEVFGFCLRLHLVVGSRCQCYNPKMPEFRLFYRRHLPHYYPPGEDFFITYRLSGSLPESVLNSLSQAKELLFNTGRKPKMTQEEEGQLMMKVNRRMFLRVDHELHKAKGPFCRRSAAVELQQPEIAAVVAQSLSHYDGTFLTLICYCIMPNHVHAIWHWDDQKRSMESLLQAIKGYSGKKANEILGQHGSFWQSETFDHVVRAGRLARTIEYVLENPLKAGLVASWDLWPYFYLNPDFNHLRP